MKEAILPDENAHGLIQITETEPHPDGERVYKMEIYDGWEWRRLNYCNDGELAEFIEELQELREE